MCEIYTFQTKLNTNIKFEKKQQHHIKTCKCNLFYFTLQHTLTHIQQILI